MLSTESIITLAIAAAGAFMTWGITKNRVDTMATKVEKLETKVEKLDGDSSTLRTQVAVMSSQLDTLTKTVTDGFANINSNLQDFFRRSAGDHK